MTLDFKLNSEIFTDNTIHDLIAYYNGECAGSIAFTSHPSDRCLEIVQIEIYEEFQNKGICQKMYQQLSNLWLMCCFNWRIEILFVNPIAEHALNSAYNKGLVCDEFMSNLNLTYNYDSATA